MHDSNSTFRTLSLRRGVFITTAWVVYAIVGTGCSMKSQQTVEAPPPTCEDIHNERLAQIFEEFKRRTQECIDVYKPVAHRKSADAEDMEKLKSCINDAVQYMNAMTTVALNDYRFCVDKRTRPPH